MASQEHHPSIVPFSLRMDQLDRMLNFEIADDPHYTGLEIQRLDDERHGRGMVVLLARRADGKTDVYFESGLRLDPDDYAIGSGLGLWVEIDPGIAHLDVAGTGVHATVGFVDAAGRRVEARIGDRTPGGRRMASFLAPMGAAISAPNALPLVWMTKFDLLRRTGPSPLIRIDGRDATIGRLPAEPLVRRRLIKVASDLCVISVNPTKPDGSLCSGRDDEATSTDGVRSLAVTSPRHRAELRFHPPFPHLESDAWGDYRSGGWTAAVDGTDLVGGLWHADRGREGVSVELEVTLGWNPTGLPLLMRTVTRVAPVFRTWPTTYRWSGSVSHGSSRVIGHWERTNSERGESYRSLTRSK